MMVLKMSSCAAKWGYSNLQATLLPRYKHTASVFLEEVFRNGGVRDAKHVHVTAKKSYPAAPSLPLPINMTQIFANETGRFTSERARDITGPVLIYQTSKTIGDPKFRFDGSRDDSSQTTRRREIRSNLYVDSYDCTGVVSLNSSMQSNVPQPFSSEGKSMHLNMPGGDRARDDKYVAENMQNFHYAKMKLAAPKVAKKQKGDVGNIIARRIKDLDLLSPENIRVTMYSTESGSTTNQTANTSATPAAGKLKRAVKDYGSTVMVFHVGISLISLGTCYLAVSSGLDIPSFVNYMGFADNEKIQAILSGSSTFVVAYAIHKLFAPARISITLATTPFLVRYLRKIGILKVK